MVTGRKQVQEETPAGAPDWMVTFSDCMTLLLTFFVLLISFATFDKDTLPMLGNSFAWAMPGVGVSEMFSEESLCEKQPSQQPLNKTQGTETRTLDKAMSSNYMREKKPLDYRNLRVFSVDSENFFWAQGRSLTPQAAETLDALCEFLLNNTGRIIIGETGPDEAKNAETGLNRALAILDYLVGKGIDKGRLNISASTIQPAPPKQRRLEITLLDRSVYE